ncbi:MAG: GntR family transcriptional regulator [Gemmatimonadota bacterium]
MYFSIDPGDARPIYVQIMDEVRRALSIGTIGADDPLPSVRQLADHLRVNPNTVQQAYRELEREGVLYVRRGRGSFISATAPREEERRHLARQVAERALRDAWRHGLDVEEFIAALRSTAKEAGSTEMAGSRSDSKGASR